MQHRIITYSVLGDLFNYLIKLVMTNKWTKIYILKLITNNMDYFIYYVFLDPIVLIDLIIWPSVMLDKTFGNN